LLYFLFSSRRRHTRWPRDWSSDVWSSDLGLVEQSLLRLRQQDPKGAKARSDQPTRSPSAAGAVFRSKGGLGLSIKTGKVWPSHYGGETIPGCSEGCWPAG